MKVCTEDHPEIVYDDSEYRAQCPLCEANKKIAELGDEIVELRDEIREIGELS